MRITGLNDDNGNHGDSNDEDNDEPRTTTATAARPQHRIARTKKFNLQILTMLFPLLEGIESCFREIIGITARIRSCSTRTIMELINQKHRGAEDLIRDEEIWERCARQVGLEGEDLEKERKRRQEQGEAGRSGKGGREREK